MSRTYRRKKCENMPEWVDHEYVCIEEYKSRNSRWKRGLWVYVALEGHKLKKSLADYHSDTNRGRNTAPTWFVNIWFTRKDRARERQELNRILQRGGDYEEYTFKPYRHGAMWEWW